MSTTTPPRLEPSASDADGLVQGEPLEPTVVAESGFTVGSFVADRRVLLARILVGVLFLAAWQGAVAVGLLNPRIFSHPVAIVERIGSFLAGERFNDATIYEHIFTSMRAMVMGYALGALLGIGLGFLLGRVRLLSKIFEPYLLALYSIPKIALAPLFILILGIGIESKIAIVTMGVFFLVFFNTFAGVVGINEEYVHLARVMGASRLQVMRRIGIPSALPSILVGLKMAIPFAMIGAIIGEFIAATRGLGWLILNTTSKFDASGLFAAIAFLVALVWLLTQALLLLESRLLRWRPTQQQRKAIKA